jgi:glucokinase
VAMALPYFTDADRAPIDAVARSDGARLPLVVLGPGTGIGVALSVPDSGGGWIPVATEGGHAELGASVLPAEIGNAIRNMVGAPIVAEDILCGDGLVRLHRAHGGTDATKGAAVVAAARDGAAPARAAIGTFVAALGAFAGDAVLHAGAFGGTYLAGGVTRALVEADLLDAGAFRSAFIDKKDYRALMASVPVAHVTFREPALLGLANAAMA